MINYVIRHPHQGRQKNQAIETIKAVIAALDINVPIPAEGDRPTIKCTQGWYEASVIHSKHSVTAVIHTYNRPALDLDLSFLDISESPDRYDSIDFL